MSTIDLHIHSNISLDGSCSIEEIMQKAKENNMKTIAITDHNSIRGIKEAIELSKKYNIEVIPGIEIDCTFNEIDFHMTCYSMNYEDKRYLEIENYYLKQNRINTWRACYRFLKETNIYISKEELEKIAIQGILVPEDICEYLLTHHEYDEIEILKPYRKGGSRSNNPNLNFYWDFFSQGKIGYFKEEKLDALDIIQLVHETNGKCVVAHPKANFKDDRILEELLQHVDGIEAYSTYHTIEECEKYYNLAKKYHLLVTCGSDYHGIHKPLIDIGKIPGNDIESKITILNKF